MKLALAIFAVIAANVAAFEHAPMEGSIKADSAMGMKLLSQARLLNEENQAVQATWVSGFSLKFQGCYNIKQWNDEADEANDVKIATKSLVRFRLCPSSGCSESKAAGCTAGYGDYIIDMNTYVAAYFEIKEQAEEQQCETILNNCDCENAENQDYCKYDCVVAANMPQCVDGNPYEEGEQVAEMEINNYLECGRYEFNNGGRELEDRVEYFLGPYCANQGGAILMGLFTEDSCTEFADETAGKTAFTELTGQTLPYSETSIVGMECLSCLGASEEQADGEVQGTVGDQCAAIYSTAGKCESSLADGITDTKNTNGCTFIDGIKIVRNDGIVSSNASTRPSPVATSFIVIFAMLFCAMAFYVWYLRKRIGVKKDSLM
jgi:hypothetical protein